MAGALVAGPRAMVQRARLSVPSNSSEAVGEQLGTGVDGSPGSGGTVGLVLSDQLVNLAVALVPLMCDVTNRPMSWVEAAEGIVVVTPTCVQSVPLREQ